MANIDKVQVGESIYNIGNVYDTIAKNAGAHNSIYRGEDITDKWYDGTLSAQIAAGTFDDIFVGDYIIGQTSGRKYLVADIDYRFGTGDTECTTHHILMISDSVMGTATMNSTNTTSAGYGGSTMRTANLIPTKTIIQNDFGTEHILTHRNRFTSQVSNHYDTALTWYDSDIDLMSEIMVLGSDLQHNQRNGTNLVSASVVDKTQLAIFKLDASNIVGRFTNGQRMWWWLRDVMSDLYFSDIDGYGALASNAPIYEGGIRPAFLIY